MTPMTVSAGRRIIIVVACAFAFVCPDRVAQGQTNIVRSLTLRACIEGALANNLDIQIERINPGISSWDVVREQGVFDPGFTGVVNYQDEIQPFGPLEATAVGINSQIARTLYEQIGLSGKLPIGTEYNLSLFDTRFMGTVTSNETVFTGTGILSLTQPLLKNFGLGPNTAAIRIARVGTQIAYQQFALQVMTTISAAQDAYYELIFAIEDHKAKIEDLNRAKRLLEENRKRVEVGVISPLEVTQAEAGVAEREGAVIVSERLIMDNQNALIRIISQNVTEYRKTTLSPVDYPIVEMVELDVARSVNTALKYRPDYLQARQELEQRGIELKFTRNQLWPEIDLQGSYGWNGQGSTFGNFIENVGSGDNPVWSVGVTVTVPLGNRQARADYKTAQLQQEQSLLNLKRLEQSIIVSVDTVVGNVQSNLKLVEATRVARRLAEESLRAEETKMLAGTSTSFLVLEAQSQLGQARSAEIRAQADYSESLVRLALVEGTTLQKNNIVLANNQ